VAEEASMDSGKPNTIRALRIGVCANALKKPPKQAAAMKAMVSLRPTTCKPLKRSQDEPQASRAGMGQVMNFMGRIIEPTRQGLAVVLTENQSY
jgi:hypothetical protein